jgi:DNA (cytosine-5)-methyltransferase 1
MVDGGSEGQQMRVVELFAGVGGFRLGLDRVNDSIIEGRLDLSNGLFEETQLRDSEKFKVVWSNQWEPGKKAQYAFDCYQSHYGISDSHVNEDIAIAKERVKSHDLLVGGFPCQDYSVARTQAKGISGKKGVLWWHINDIILAQKPKYVLLENVDRLLRSPTAQRGRDFGIILRCLADNGYAVEWRVINAAEYGFPQRRRRVFIFAYREDTKFFKSNKKTDAESLIMNDGFFAKEFPILGPITDKSDSFSIGGDRYETLADVSEKFANMIYNGGVMRNNIVYTRECRPVPCKNQINLENIIEKKVDKKYYVDDLKIEKWKYLKGTKKMERVSKLGIKYKYSEGAIAFPDHLDRPGRTMLTSEGTLNRCSHIISDKDNEYRILTPIECERLNGFDDDWTNGDCPERFRYFAMGNALVVPLISKMGRRILEIDQ